MLTARNKRTLNQQEEHTHDRETRADGCSNKLCEREGMDCNDGTKS